MPRDVRPASADVNTPVNREQHPSGGKRLRPERLVISGPSGGQYARASVTPTSRAVLEQMWNALVEAGAIPAS
jgi:hypothetical protein